ncbi:uncharacterized protein JCM6883_000076 [Sporobolomyces salmoneus]|uniref:uncharacterized protein n=1 Tax=Sporobolomyces salmoneus TaxID=183962 RepID=UPI0031736A00
MATPYLTTDQRSTYDSLVSFGFSPAQATHAAIRYGANSEGAANWLMDNSGFDFDTPLPTTSSLSATTTTGTGIEEVNDYRPSTPITELRLFDGEVVDDELPPLVSTLEGEKQGQGQGEGLSPPDYESVYGPRHYTEEKFIEGLPEIKTVTPSSTAVVPFNQRPKTCDIDLTKEDSSSDSDFQKAIQQSTSTATGTGMGVGVSKEDEEINKALMLSMASLTSSQQEGGGEPEFFDSLEERIKPEERIRDSLEVPVVLRSLSPLMNSLSGYLTCLYASETWRNTILGWRRPDELLVDISGGTGEEKESLEGVWKGEVSEEIRMKATTGTDEGEARVNRISSLQRLFTLMKHSHRSFLHIEEIVVAFNLRESEFHKNSGMDRIKELHNLLISDLLSLAPTPELKSTISTSFTTHARRLIPSSISHISAPLPPLPLPLDSSNSNSNSNSEEERVSTNLIELEVNSIDPQQNFYERLDNLLFDDSGAGPGEEEEGEGEWRLLMNPLPKTLGIELKRMVEFTSLDSFGSTSNSNHASSTSTSTTNVTTTGTSTGVGSMMMGPRKLFELSKEIYLDRYHQSRRLDIFQTRQSLKTYTRELNEMREKRGKLGMMRPGPDGKEKETVEEVKGCLEFLEKSLKDGEGQGEMGEGRMDEGEEEKRKERQGRLRDSYRAILARIEPKLVGSSKFLSILTRFDCSELGFTTEFIIEYDSQLVSLESSISSLYSSPTWRTLGPYKLVSFLFRNGLNGRGSLWSISRSLSPQNENGRDEWYRISHDLSPPERVDLEEMLKDRTGLMMDAGIAWAIYQRDGVEEVERDAPEDLKRAVELDNYSFAQTLPRTPEMMDRIKGWNFSPQLLEALSQDQDEAIPISIDSIDSVGGEEEEATVTDIALSPPPPLPASNEKEEEVGGTPMSMDGLTPVPIAVDDDEELEPLIPPTTGNDKQGEGDTEMTGVSSSDEEEREIALRLRGGATLSSSTESEEEDEDDGEEEDEEDEDDYPEEDEVELGLLQPMPTNREEWNIDFAVGKIGGTPIWLDPRSPLTREDVLCEGCGEVMSLLLQVNSPDDTKPHAAARSLYVYACREGKCQRGGSGEGGLKVWRTQMRSPNEFYPHTEKNKRKRRELEANLDQDTALGRVSPTTTTTTTASTRRRVKSWPEWDIVAEPEPYEESYLPDPSAPNLEEAEGGGEDVDAPDSVSGVDKEFLIFQERIEREPRQVLRFYRLPDIETPSPLWTSKKKIDPSSVPPCELCRGPREVEFQILSMLLSHLNDDSVEFDSLLVYTCLGNCEIPPRLAEAPGEDGEKKTTGWAKEMVYRQEFTSSGVRFGMN